MVAVKLIIVLLIFFSYIRVCNGMSSSKCKITSNHIDLIIDYLTWRHLNNVIIYNENLKGGSNFLTIKKSMAHFKKSGIFVTFFSRLDNKEYHQSVNHKIGMVIFSCLEDSHLDEFHKDDISLYFYSERFVWLIVFNDIENHSEDMALQFKDEIKKLPIGLNSDFVVAYFYQHLEGIKAIDGKPFTILCNQNETKNLKQQNSSSNGSNMLPIPNNPHFNLCENDSMCYSACLIQYYKIRRTNEHSLIVQNLGQWTSRNHTELLKPLIQVEKRTNFHNFTLTYGTKNSSTIQLSNEENNMDDEIDAYNSMTEILDYLLTYFNSTSEKLTFNRLGSKNLDGLWTDLLGAVNSEKVDFVLDGVIKTTERNDDFIFSHNIMKSIKNIYVKPQESNELRDIFFLPFGPKLLICVEITSLLLIFAMFFVSNLNISTTKPNMKNYNKFSDALIWCIAIFSMQGSIWKPKSYSGNTVVIIALVFALLIYNSYSAFITSILSVEIPKIQSLNDLLASDYKIGYIKNSQDEVYLRSTNDSQLKQIYLRGYLDNTVVNVSQGLYKAAKGNFAFFASSHIARKGLQDFTNYKCVSNIKEIHVKSTSNDIAFPMSRTSPYGKIINLGIIKMYETGIYKHMHRHLVPELPECTKLRKYNTAGLPDLMSAFGVLIFGLIGSIILLVAECIWKKKTNLYNFCKKKKYNNKKLQVSLPARIIK